MYQSLMSASRGALVDQMPWPLAPWQDAQVVIVPLAACPGCRPRSSRGAYRATMSMYATTLSIAASSASIAAIGAICLRERVVLVRCRERPA